jgi:hypothetical protein
VIAVSADQHLGEQRRRRQTAGDRPFRRGRLCRGVARATGVFRARDAQHAELGGNPVDHLADALPNDVQNTSTARTSVVRHVDHDLFARQMIGQRLAPWPLVGDLDVYVRAVRFGAPDVAIETIQTEGELIGIKARNGGRTASAEAV